MYSAKYRSYEKGFKSLPD